LRPLVKQRATRKVNLGWPFGILDFINCYSEVGFGWRFAADCGNQGLWTRKHNSLLVDE
jgi:hypothetical protein